MGNPHIFPGQMRYVILSASLGLPQLDMTEKIQREAPQRHLNRIFRHKLSGALLWVRSCHLSSPPCVSVRLNSASCQRNSLYSQIFSHYSELMNFEHLWCQRSGCPRSLPLLATQHILHLTSVPFLADDGPTGWSWIIRKENYFEWKFSELFFSGNYINPSTYTLHHYSQHRVSRDESYSYKERFFISTSGARTVSAGVPWEHRGCKVK